MPLYVVYESSRKFRITIKCQCTIVFLTQKHFQINFKFFQKLGKISESIRNYFQMFGKNSKPIRKFFQNAEKFPNIFKKNSTYFELFPNLLGIFSKCHKSFQIYSNFFQTAQKHYVIIQIKNVWKHNLIYKFASAASQIYSVIFTSLC